VGTNGQPYEVQQAAMIPLDGVAIAVGHPVGKPDEKLLLIGPVSFVLPLNEEARKAVVAGLTGLIVAGPQDIHGL